MAILRRKIPIQRIFHRDTQSYFGILLDDNNRLTRSEALRAYTLGSAWFSSEEQVKGRIAPGQYADLAVLSEDYFSVEAEAIGDIESVLTLVGGRIVHAAKEFAPLAPPLPAPSPAWSPVTRFGGAWRSDRYTRGR